MFDEQDRQYFYNEFKNNGYEVGSYDDFKKDLNNKEDRDWYYNEAKNMGYDVGTLEDFDKMVLEPAPSTSGGAQQVAASTQSVGQNASTETKPQVAQPAAKPAAEKPKEDNRSWFTKWMTGSLPEEEKPETADKEPGLIAKALGMIPTGVQTSNGTYQPSPAISQPVVKGEEKPVKEEASPSSSANAASPESKEAAPVTTPTSVVNNEGLMDAKLANYLENWKQRPDKQGTYFENMVADLLADGTANSNEEAVKMVQSALGRYANRSAMDVTNQVVSSLPDDTVQDAEQSIEAQWYSHGVQDKLKQEADSMGISYDDYVAQFLKPVMVQSLVNKYGPNYRNIAEGIATRLYAHDEHVQDRLMNQDINDALSSVIKKYVDSSVVDEYNKAQEAGSKAFTEGMEGSQFIPANLRLGTALGAQYEANEAKDPAKVLSSLRNKFGKLYRNPKFLNDMSNAAFKVMQRYGLNGTLSSDPKQFKPMINSVLKNELDQLEIKGMMPKGSAEYIINTGLGNTIVGKIIRKAVQTDYQNWLEDIANQQYQPGFWENVASGALTFAGDAWSYWLPGAAGGKLTKSMLAKAEGRLAGDLMAKGMESRMAARAAKLLIGKSKTEALKSGAVHGAVTFGGQSAISKPIDEKYRTGQFDENGKIYNPSGWKIALDTLLEGGKQSALGVIMQGNTIANMIGKGRGLATNILADIGGKVADSGIMTGHQMLERMAQDPNFKPTGKDAAESFLESMANLTAIGLPGMVGKYARFKDAREFNKKYDFTDQDIAELKRFGYEDLRDAFEKVGIGEYSVEGENAQRLDGQLTQKYMNLMNDKSVPEVLKAKMMAVVEGKRPSSFSPVVDSVIVQPMDNGGKVYLETLNKDGGIIERKEYSSLDDAQKADKKLEYEKTLGLASVLEGEFHNEFTQEHLDGLYNQAAQKYNMGEKLTDEDKAAVYLHQNAGAIKEIMDKQQKGILLTEEEQKQVDAYRHFYNSALENSSVMREFVNTFEDSHGVARGTLRKALESKDKKYAPLVESYLKELYNSIELKREMKQTVDDLYNTAHGNEQKRIEQSGIEGEKPAAPVEGAASVEGAAGGQEPPVSEEPAPYQDRTNSVPSPSDANSAVEVASSAPNVAASDAFVMGQNAYKNGDSGILKAIDYNSDLATGRLKRAFADSDTMFDLVTKTYNEGRDMEQFVAQRAGNLTLAQKEAISKYVEAMDAKKGAIDALQHADDGYGEALKEQLWPYQTEDGNIVPATLTSGKQVFLKKANEYGGGFVVVPDEQGQPTIKQVSNAEIKEVGTPVPLDEYIESSLAQQKEARNKQFISQFDGSGLKPNDRVAVAMEEGDANIDMTFAGYSEDGKIVLSDGKDYLPLSKEEFAAWRTNALNNTINERLDREDGEREMAELKQAETDKQERYKKGIFGYAAGQPDYSDTQTDPKVAAEYLQETAGEDRKALFANIVAEKQALQKRINQLRDHIASNEEWLSINADLDPKNAETRTLANKQMEGQIADLQARFDNWNKIRSAVMTPEEAQAIKADRTQKIADAGVNEGDVAPIEGREVAVFSDEELKKQYPTMDEASDFIASERKRIYRIQSDEVQREIDGVDKVLDRYVNGEIDLEPEQIKELNTTKAQLQARQANLTESAKELKAQADKLKTLYRKENMEARAKAVEDMTPAEQRAIKVENAIKNGNMNQLNSIYEEVRGATDFNDTEPNTPEEYVANNIGRFTLNYEGKEKGGAFTNGIQQETGLGRKDFEKLQILAKEGEGKTVPEFVHSLYDDMPMNLKQMGYTDHDIRSAFLDLIGSAQSYSDIKNYTLNNKVANVEQLMRDVERQEEEMKENGTHSEAFDKIVELAKEQKEYWDLMGQGEVDPDDVPEVDVAYDMDELLKTLSDEEFKEVSDVLKGIDEEFEYFTADEYERREGANERKKKVENANTYDESINEALKPVTPFAYALKSAVESGDKKAVKKAQKELTDALIASDLGHDYLSGQLAQAKLAKKKDELYKVKRATVKPLTDAIRAIESDENIENASFADRLKNAIAETETEPTEAQKKAGNYKKGHLTFGGYDFTVETPKGVTRSGKDEQGKPWSVTMHDTYGYILGKIGVDGDHIDMFINDADLDSFDGNVYVVDQVTQETGEFDEHKVMYGYPSEETATEAYLANYSKGWKGLGKVTAVPKATFDKWLESSDRKTKPFAEYAMVQKEQAKKAKQANEALPFDAPMNMDDLPFHRDVKEVKPSEMTEAQKVAYDAVSTMLKKAGIPVKVVSNEDMEKVAEAQDNLNLAMLLNQPEMRFKIKTPEEKQAAENAYNFAKDLRPNKWAQYAVVDMSNPNKMPEYYQKQELARKERTYLNRLMWGNYKVFNLDKSFEDNVAGLTGSFPSEFDPYKIDAQTSKKNELKKQIKETEEAYKSTGQERKEYQNQLMKEYMDEHGLASENDIPDDVWREFDYKAVEKYQDKLDSLFAKYKDLDRQLKAVAEPGVRFLRTYHGTGASFSEFDFDHMGEGEGSQAFGWGGYVTSSKMIGKNYATLMDNDPSRAYYRIQHSNGTRFAKKYPTLGSFLHGDKQIAMNDKFTEQEKIDYYNEMKKLAEPYHNLYEVDIPDDNGSNYLDWDAPLTDKQKNTIIKELRRLKIDFANFKKRGFSFDGSFGGNSYDFLMYALRKTKKWKDVNASRAVSKFLSSLGYTGIKYKAGRNFGGAEEGDTNYVIFKPEDMKIVDHTKFAQNKGVVYGYTDGKEIVLNQEHLNPNTPIHEYQHLWRTAAKEMNPELIAHGDELIKQTQLFADLKEDENYKHLSDDEICDEAFARLTGEDGAAILEQMAKDAIKENPLDTAKELTIINRLKNWLKKFWYWTLDTFTKWKPEDIKKMTLEDIRNLVLRDLANGVDPRNVKSRMTKEDAVSLRKQMEDNAEQERILEHTEENWQKEFGKDSRVTTPIGSIKLGENQYKKAGRNDRIKRFGLLKPTLERPDVILEKSAPKEGAERQTKYLFIKSFKKADGNKILNYESITVKQGEEEVAISAHQIEPSKVVKELTESRVLWNRFRGDSNSLGENQGSALTPSANNPSGKDSVLNPHSDAKIRNNIETAKGNGGNLSVEDKIKAVSQQFGVDEADVAMYANAVKKGSTAEAARARANIKRYLLQANEDKISSFKDIIKYTKPVNEALKENFGDLDAMIEERKKQVEAQRNAMEAARKRAEEEEAKRQKHLEELSLIPDDQLDKQYMDALAKGDDATAREMLDEAARRKGYDDTESAYQGVGAWAAPGNPGYESDKARRDDWESSGSDVNLEDMALGYTPQPDDYFSHPERYSQNTPHGLESVKAINTAIDAIKNGEKDVKVKVYRAVPTSVKEGKLRNGDWVTPSKKYAEMHGTNRLDGKYRIIEDEVPATQLWWDGNDANEFGFDDGKEYKYKNAKNNRKLNDLVTYDDEGDVIPPSKRFNSRKSDIRFMFGGEKGAAEADKAEEKTYRMDNLKVAKVMEEHALKPIAIKYATGWERGADGKWRYEMPDFKADKPITVDADIDILHVGPYSPYKEPLCKLSNLIDDKNLFAAYPSLKNIDILLVGNTAFEGMYDKLHNNIALRTNAVSIDSKYSQPSNAKEIKAALEKFHNFWDSLTGEDKELADDAIDAYGGYTEEELKEDSYFRELEKGNPKVAELVRLGNSIPSKKDVRFEGTQVALNHEGKLTLAHEIQHAIQYIEGFGKGGSPEQMEKEFKEAQDEWKARAYAHELEEKAKEMGGEYNQSEVEKALVEEYKDLDMSDELPDKETRIKGFNYFARGYADRSMDDTIKRFRLNESTRFDFDSYKEYLKLAGEVESRNVEKRLGMTDEERRNSLAEETEDVPRDSQIVSGNARASYKIVEQKLQKHPDSLMKAGTYFSGGGLVEEGLKGIIDPVVAVEYDRKISGVYRNNFGQHIVTADVRDVDPKELVKHIDGEVEYFHASPVCKNYSQAKSNGGEVELDKETAKSTADFINAVKPRVVTIENVKGYKDSEAMKIITQALDKNGYTWDADVYNAADYGGYTNRERLIVRAVKDGELPEKPKKQPHKGGWLEAVEDILPTLTVKESGVAPWMDARLKADGIDWQKVEKPLYVMGSAYADGKIPHAYGDEILPTLRTKSGDVIIMPGGKVLRADGRVLARITGLGDDYLLPKTESLAHTIIGNGIPVQLTQSVIAPLLNKDDLSGRNVLARLGKSIFKNNWDADKQKQVSDQVVNTANKLGGAEATVYTSVDEVPDAYLSDVKNGATGWYDPTTHTVHVYLPNCADANEAQRTVFHEKIGHEGMEVLLGGEDKVRKFANFVYNSVAASTRGKILEIANEYDPDWKKHDRMNVGTQEYIAHLAEEGPKTAEDFSLWTKIKHYLIKVLKKLGIRVPGLLNDKDLRYYLMKAGKALHVWDEMPQEKQEAMMKQASNAEIKDSLGEGAKNGKPRQKKGESMVQYMKRVQEWRKWKNAREDENDPEPPMFYDIDKDEAGKKEWAQLNKDWRERHHLAGEEPTGLPIRMEGEEDGAYMTRIHEYEKWKDAMKDQEDPMPDMFAFEKKKQEEVKRKYEDWLARHELLEQQQADLDLYEGKIYPAETNPKADDLEQQVMQDLAEVTSTDVSKEGAARSVHDAVIYRRKNIESASADDAIFINSVKQELNKMANASYLGKKADAIADAVKETVTGKSPKTQAKKMAEAIPYIIEAPRRMRDIADEMNAVGAFENGHIHVTAKDIDAIQPFTDELRALASKSHKIEKDGKETIVYDDVPSMTEVASKMAKAINDNHVGEEGFVPVDGTDILAEHVLLVVLKCIVPEGIEYKNLSEEMQSLLDKIREWYDKTFTWLKDSHTVREDIGYTKDYVNHRWDKEKSDDKAYADLVEGRQRTKSPNEKPRKVSTYMEGVDAGLVPKTTDITDLLAYYSQSNIEAFANKTFLQELSGINVIERNKDGEITSSMPLLSSIQPKEMMVDENKYTPYVVPGINTVWVYNQGKIFNKSAEDWFNAAFGTVKLSKVLKGILNSATL
jgi:site-specific DNA-cytosine methylase